MERNSGSFRDPSGWVFEKEGRIFRTVNAAYKEHFTALINSGGLYIFIQEVVAIKPFDTQCRKPPHLFNRIDRMRIGADIPCFQRFAK